MFRLNISLPILVVVLGVINGEELYVNCSKYTKCVPISSCNSLVYNFTLLSDEDKRLALQPIQCNGTEINPWICCASCGSIPTFDDMEEDPTSLAEHPWMVALNYRLYDMWNRVLCGGSLINQRYVATTAHCLVEKSAGGPGGVLIEAILAEYNLQTFEDCVTGVCINATHINIDEIIIHPDYDNETFANDIGLIRLKTNVEYSNYIKPICLPSTVDMLPSTDGDVLEICGWGENLVSRNQVKDKLFIPSYNHTACHEKFPKKYNISDTQLCAGGTGIEDGCRGDGGSPLMKLVKKSFVLEGILSFGTKQCGMRGWPNVYTRVSSFEPWIRKNIRP